ncbi:glycine cleavage system protein R [Agarilytica rhodophyticola]|uniref:glycine cleavage system protein R n=1 Tax=Agarilytica rhodophyticola TaxID=1737490 RepID=UPI001315711F|nr:ACT domain-containing protein [Agarilytica rhodophyticola]
MLKHILISVISNDKPGVVEAIAETVSDNGGNWLESSLSQLAGKFAGVIRVSVSPEQQEQLQSALSQLIEHGIWIKTEHIDADSAPKSDTTNAYIHALGPDRSGIVRELSRALAQHKINMAYLETALTSMPYSGDPLFDATGQLELPEGVDIPQLHDILDEIANNLALDLSLSETPFE